jgi:hypothetical protein
MRYILILGLLAGCEMPPPGAANYQPPRPAFAFKPVYLAPAPFMYQPRVRTHCRPDGFGGVYCS